VRLDYPALLRAGEQKWTTRQGLKFRCSVKEALGINQDTPLQVNINGNSLIITPVNAGIGKEAVSESIKKLHRIMEICSRIWQIVNSCLIR